MNRRATNTQAIKVLELRYLEKKTLKDIANITGLSETLCQNICSRRHYQEVYDLFLETLRLTGRDEYYTVSKRFI